MLFFPCFYKQTYIYLYITLYSCPIIFAYTTHKYTKILGDTAISQTLIIIVQTWLTLKNFHSRKASVLVLF